MKVGDKVRITVSGFSHGLTAKAVERPEGQPPDPSGAWVRFDEGYHGNYFYRHGEVEVLDDTPAPDLKIKTAAQKAPLQLVPINAQAGTARVFQHGGAKYEPGNFLLATDDEAPARYCGALLRHLASMQEPNGLFTWSSIKAVDEESGLPHIDHAIASLLMLRAVAIKTGALPVDPGVSKMIGESK